MTEKTEQKTDEQEFERKGYESWVDLWVSDGCRPTASKCPARYMKEGLERNAFIRGWIKAQKEAA